MKIDLPLLDDISESDRRVLMRSAVKIAARVAAGGLDARALAKRLDEIVSETDVFAMDANTIRSGPDYAQPPTEAPRIYSAAENMKPSAFLEMVYGNWMAAGSLFQPTIRKLDRALMKALDKEFTGRREVLRQMLPTKSEAVTRDLEDLVGGRIGADQRKRLIKVGKTVKSARQQLVAS